MNHLNKLKLIVTLPNKLGGVASFNRNILRFFDSKIIDVSIVLISIKEEMAPPIIESIKCDEIIQFEYSKYENYFHVVKKFSYLLEGNASFVLCDNSLTLHALRFLKSRSKVFFLNHDFYYVQLALEFSDVIDKIICHSTFYNDCLLAADFNKFSKKLIYLPYGVPVMKELHIRENVCLNLVFLGRLVESKGVMHLLEIENVLCERNINVHWHIIGDGPLYTPVFNEWSNKSNIQFHKPQNAASVYSILRLSDILIFPSYFEGTPVAIYEALSCGCAVIANDIPGGVRDTVVSESGFLVGNNDVNEFADCIELLNSNRQLLKEKQIYAFNFAKNHLDESKRNVEYLNFICDASGQVLMKEYAPFKLNGLLNRWYIPNLITMIYRKFKYDK